MVHTDLRLLFHFSGDRNGNIVRIDCEGIGDLSEGYGTLIASPPPSSSPSSQSNANYLRTSNADQNGITNLVPMDDTFVWSANSRSEIYCWRDIGRRGSSSSPLPYKNMVRLNAPSDVGFLPNSLFPTPLSASYKEAHFQHQLTEKEREKQAFQSQDVLPLATALYTSPLHTIPGARGLTRSLILSSRLHALAVSTSGAVSLYSLITCSCIGFFPADLEEFKGCSGPRERLEIVKERIEGECVTGGWCDIDTKVGELSVGISVNGSGSGKGWETEWFGDDLGVEGVEYDDEYRGARECFKFII